MSKQKDYREKVKKPSWLVTYISDWIDFPFEIYYEMKSKYQLYKFTTRDDVEKLLNDKDFQVDWIGRISTIFEIPNEFLENSETRESYIVGKFHEHTMFFNHLGISDLVYPDLEPIAGDKVFVIYEARNFATSISMIKQYIFRTCFVYLPIFWFLNKILTKFEVYPKVFDFFNWLM